MVSTPPQLGTDNTPSGFATRSIIAAADATFRIRDDLARCKWWQARKRAQLRRDLDDAIGVLRVVMNGREAALALAGDYATEDDDEDDMDALVAVAGAPL